MRKKIAIALTAGVAAATVGLGAAGTASAAPKNAGAACVLDGIGFLKAIGLLQQAAQKQIDYSTLGPDGSGLIMAQFRRFEPAARPGRQAAHDEPGDLHLQHRTP